MSRLIMLVGVAGSGKSSLALKLASQNYKSRIFSSDALRMELYNDENDQDHNTELFQILNRRIFEWLRIGGTAIYDATNLSSKRRIDFLKHVPAETFKECVIVTATEDTCVTRQLQRPRKVSRDVIHKQCCSFQTPTYREGWFLIQIYNTDEGYNLKSIVAQSQTMDQKNIHHDDTIGKHNSQVQNSLLKIGADPILCSAGGLHDIGKVFTQIIDQNGQGHYYSHDNYGAYVIISSIVNVCSYLNICDSADEQINKILNIAFLVNHHMDLFNIQTEKQFDRWITRNGLSEQDVNYLRLLHQVDLDNSCQDKVWREGKAKFYGNLSIKK